MVLMKQFCKIEAETAEPLSTVPCLQYVQPFLPLSEKCLFYLEVIAFQRQAILISYQVSESNKKSLLIELGKATEQNIEWGFFPPYKPNRSCATHNWKKIDIHYWRSVFPPRAQRKLGRLWSGLWGPENSCAEESVCLVAMQWGNRWSNLYRFLGLLKQMTPVWAAYYNRLSLSPAQFRRPEVQSRGVSRAGPFRRLRGRIHSLPLS